MSGSARPSSSRGCASSSIAATTRRAWRCWNERRELAVVRCRGKLGQPRGPARDGAADRARSASATRAGRRTAGRPTRTRTRTRSAACRVVHNGIIENHLALRAELMAQGAQLLVGDRHRDRRPPGRRGARRRRARRCPRRCGARSRRCEGAYAHRRDVATTTRTRWSRRRTPRRWSSASATARTSSPRTSPRSSPHTRKVIFLDEGEIADAHAGRASRSSTSTGKPHRARAARDHLERGAGGEGRLQALHAQGDPRAAARGHRHAARAPRSRGSDDASSTASSSTRHKHQADLIIVACGTSYHASLVGKFLIEELARIPVEVDLACEFRYRDPIIGEGDLLLAICQSGETADTMAAVKEAQGARRAVARASPTSSSRRSRAPPTRAFYTHAGPEIGVASTKAFTTQLVALALLAIHLGRRTGALTPRGARGSSSTSSSHLPHKMSDVVDQARAAPGARAALRPRATASCSSGAATSTRSRSRARSS